MIRSVKGEIRREAEIRAAREDALLPTDAGR
jgi:hypothetical protein